MMSESEKKGVYAICCVLGGLLGAFFSPVSVLVLAVLLALR